VAISATDGSVFVPAQWEPWPGPEDVETYILGSAARHADASGVTFEPLRSMPGAIDQLTGVGTPKFGTFVDPLAAPWRSVGKLRVHTGLSTNKVECTGTLVGSQQVVISAAHCFFRDRFWKQDLPHIGFTLFHPGWDSGNPMPFGAHLVTWYYMPGQWFDWEQYYRDWSLLALASSAPVEYWGAGSRAWNKLLTDKFHMVAYPVEKNDGDHQWKDDCSAISVFTSSLRHDCQSWDGSSGAAVYRYINGNEPQILAVNKGNPWANDDENYNVGVRLTGDRIDKIKSFIETWG